MCGIFGIIARNTSIRAGLLAAATSSLAHRGPDDSGTVTLRASAPEPLEIGLGNRRLAVLDLSPLGHQPIGTEHQEILVSQHDALASILHALRAMDQPTIDGINTFLTSRQTRAAGIKVALCGLGGDEVFAGYATFKTVPRMERGVGDVCHGFCVHRWRQFLPLSHRIQTRTGSSLSSRETATCSIHIFFCGCCLRASRSKH